MPSSFPLPTPTPTSGPLSSKVPSADTPASLVATWGLSPFPAWAFTTALLASTAVRTPAVAIPTSTSAAGTAASAAGAALKGYRTPKIVSAYPSNMQVAVFGAFTALGGFMCYDNDPKNGSAVVGVWSLLYVLANAKKSMWNLKFMPKALTGMALVNAALYGGKFAGIV